MPEQPPGAVTSASARPARDGPHLIAKGVRHRPHGCGELNCRSRLLHRDAPHGCGEHLFGPDATAEESVLPAPAGMVPCRTAPASCTSCAPRADNRQAPAVRSLAAHLWFTTKQTATTAHPGSHPAADASPRVRCTLARELPDDENHAAVREVLQPRLPPVCTHRRRPTRAPLIARKGTSIRTPTGPWRRESPPSALQGLGHRSLLVINRATSRAQPHDKVTPAPPCP